MPDVSELKRAGAKGSLWNFLTSITGQLRNFIVSLVLARLLAPSDFGLISMALVFNSVFDTLIDFGFSNAVIQSKEITQKQKSTIFYLNLIFGAFFTTVLFLCAPLMADFFQMPELSQIVRFTSFSFILGALGTLQVSLFQKELNFKIPFKAKFISSIISGAVGIAMALLGTGVWALVVNNLCAWGLNSAVLWWKSEWRPSKEFDLTSVHTLWDYGWKFTATTVISKIFKQIDTFVIGRLYSASALGFFNRAQSLNNLVIDYSFSSIRSVLLPTFSKLQDDKQKFRHSVIKLINTICFLNFLFSGLMFVTAKDLITLLYGERWIDSVYIFKILAFFSITLSLPVLYDAIMSALAKMTLYFNIGLIRKPILLFAIPIGIYYGLEAYIWAINIANVISLLPYVWAAKKCIGLSYSVQIFTLLKYTILFLFCLVALTQMPIGIANHLLNAILVAIIYSILYIGICYCLKFDGLQTCINLLNQFRQIK